MGSFVLLSVALLSTTGISERATPPAQCNEVRLSQDYVCRATDKGIVFANSAEDLEWGLGVAVGVEREFTRYFGPVPRYALIVGDEGAGASAELDQAGFRRHFVWASPRTAAARVRDALGASLRETYRREGTGEPELTAKVEQTLRNFPGYNPSTQANALAHELGHILVEAFWDGRARRKSSPHYGTPGPDWLDEIAALLMESDESRNSRRQLLREMHRGGRIVPLLTYLQATHPTIDPEPEPGRAGHPPRRRDTPPDAVAEYYAQSVGFADFLVETSKQPRIFEAIARRLSGGWSFGRWLAMEGRRYRLPSHLSDLNGMWEEWLLRRYGAKR